MGLDLLGKVKALPDVPGIYLFYNEAGDLVYVGKATSLKNRVLSGYFRGQATATTPPPSFVRRGIQTRPIEEMIHEVVNIEWRETDSVLEAVILESVYIKKFLPKYNVLGKDGKSWNYILITDELYPRVITMRQREYLSLRGARSERRGNPPVLPGTKMQGDRHGLLRRPRDDKNVFGPYPGLNTRATMKVLRKLFLFSTCEPAKPPPNPLLRDDHPPRLRPPLLRKEGSHDEVMSLDVPSLRRRGARGGQLRPCLYREIGLCLGVCTGEITAKEYRRRVIAPLKWFLAGKKKSVIRAFEQQMKLAAKEHDFEEAGRLRDQIANLQRIHDVTLINKSFFEEPEEVNPPLRGARGMFANVGITSPGPVTGHPPQGGIRIEGYDISNLGATDKVGSMVVFDASGPVKSEYRKFNIKTVEGQSDVDCLAEVLERRLKRNDWPMPDVILIDGGRPQVNRIQKVFKQRGVTIPFMGIAKGAERKRNDIILGTKEPAFVDWVYKHQSLLVRVRDEAHRFAITFNRSKRRIKR